MRSLQRMIYYVSFSHVAGETVKVKTSNPGKEDDSRAVDIKVKYFIALRTIFGAETMQITIIDIRIDA